MKNVPNNVLERIGMYADKLQEAINEQFAKHYPNLKAPVVVVNMGYKYAQIVKENGQNTVHSFIDLKNGDILKAASWAQPAKGIRGSIFWDNCGVGSAVNWIGAVYFKGGKK